MKRLLISYTKAINKRFSRVGSLFQGAFRAKAITDSRTLLQVCVYIHANPVKDGLVSDPCDWPYSNYPEWIGERDGTLVDREFIRSEFAEPAEYRQLVCNYLKAGSMPGPVCNHLAALDS